MREILFYWLHNARPLNQEETKVLNETLKRVSKKQPTLKNRK